MKCSACGCPGAVQLFTTIVCPNLTCRWGAWDRCERDYVKRTINGERDEVVYAWLQDHLAKKEVG